ncbi:hypothetical protein FHT76_007988 [Rhizobium sp. BK176]|nr:hypothetical protein [Rhizobium sp. BK181]MBB3543032.1 hypothetical protein [Rhizobium sp. BK399]MCS3742249.1 hypothetical protein [Rhizobium sp. BK661]MCS4096267.1 hypothetical protein [Rhizobium sp. BK176]
MKAVTAITWKHILDWLAEAGSICSGMFIEYRESRDSSASRNFRDRDKLFRRDSWRPMSR